MITLRQPARVNYRVLLITAGVLAVLAVVAVIGHRVQRRAMAREALQKGLEAYGRQDWPAACTNLRQYLARNPNDVAILEKLSQAQISVRPLDQEAIKNALYSYRNLLRLKPTDPDAFEQLVSLYAAVRNFNEVAYLAQKRLQVLPEDPKAMLWLAKASIAQRKPDQAVELLQKTLKQCEGDNDKHAEYVEACLLMSGLVSRTDSSPYVAKTLAWFDRALQYDPNSIVALLRRARLYRTLPATADRSREKNLADAQADLERLESLKPEDPGVRLTLCSEWMKHNRLDKAMAQMELVKQIDSKTVLKYFSDYNEWVIGKFLQETELVLMGDPKGKGAPLAEETLKTLTLPRHRLTVLPSAIRLFLADRKPAEARRYLNEYLDLQNTRESNPEPKEKVALLQAMVASVENDSYQVINLLEPLTARNAGQAELWGLLAEAYTRTNQPRRAIKAMTEYLRLVPNDNRMLREAMDLYAQQRDWASVAKLASQYKPQDASDISVKLLAIEARMNIALERSGPPDLGEINALVAELTTLQKSFPDRADIRMLKATLSAGQGNLAQAEKELAAGVGNEHTDSLTAQLQLAGMLFNQKQKAKAMAICRETCQKHPEKAQTWLTLAEMQKADRQYKEALDTLRSGLEKVTDPRQKEYVLTQMAILQIRQGDRPAGLKTLHTLAEKNANDVQVRSLLLSLPEIYQDPAQAQKWVDDLHRIQGDTGLLWRLHQSSLWLKGSQWRVQQKEITEHLNMCIQADPGWSAPVLLLGGMYERLGRNDSAEAVYRRLVAANPSVAEVSDRLVNLLEQQKRFSEAREVLGKSQQTSSTISLRRIRASLKAGDVSQAVDELKLHVQDDPKSVQSLALLARLVYSQTKDTKEAFKYLDQAEAIDPGAIPTLSARAAILRAEGKLAEVRKILDDRVKKGDCLPALLLRADFYAGSGDKVQAEADYRQLAALDPTGQGYELLGTFYADSQRIDDAVAAWRKGLTVHPKSLTMKRRLMKMLFLRGKDQDHKDALTMLSELEAKLPNDQDLLYVRSLALLAEGTDASKTRAREYLERIVQQKPTAVDAHLRLIGLAMQYQDLIGARDLAIRALSTNPDHRDLVLFRAQAEFGLRNFQTAGDLARMVVREDPTNADALAILVEVVVTTQDKSSLQELRPLVEKAIGKNPSNDRLRILRAIILKQSGQVDQAIADLEAIGQSSGKQPPVSVLLSLAEFHRIKGQLEVSGKYLDQAENREPGNPIVVRERMVWWGVQKKYGRVVSMVRELRSKKVRNPGLLDIAAAILASSDDPAGRDEAIAVLEYLTALTPQMTDIHLRLAWLVYQKGDYDRAEAGYRKVLAMDSNNLQAINNLAWIMSDIRRNYAEALKLADRGLALAPKDIHLLDTRGTILVNLPDRMKQAQADFEACATLAPSQSPDQARALVKLGRIFVKLGDTSRAKDSLEKALQIDVRHAVFTADERTEIKDVLKTVSSPSASAAKTPAS